MYQRNRALQVNSVQRLLFQTKLLFTSSKFSFKIFGVFHPRNFTSRKYLVWMHGWGVEYSIVVCTVGNASRIMHYCRMTIKHYCRHHLFMSKSTEIKIQNNESSKFWVILIVLCRTSLIASGKWMPWFRASIFHSTWDWENSELIRFEWDSNWFSHDIV